MGSSLAEVVFWGQCFSQGTDIGSLQCLQKVEAWQSPTRFNVIQRAKIKQYVFCLVGCFFGPCSKLHSTAVALCVGVEYVKRMGIQYFLVFLFKAAHGLRRSSPHVTSV